MKRKKEAQIVDKTEMEMELDKMGVNLLLGLDVPAVGGNKLAVSLRAALVSWM